MADGTIPTIVSTIDAHAAVGHAIACDIVHVWGTEWSRLSSRTVDGIVFARVVGAVRHNRGLDTLRLQETTRAALASVLRAAHAQVLTDAAMAIIGTIAALDTLLTDSDDSVWA